VGSSVAQKRMKQTRKKQNNHLWSRFFLLSTCKAVLTISHVESQGAPGYNGCGFIRIGDFLMRLWGKRLRHRGSETPKVERDFF